MQKITNLVIALATIVLAALLFWGVQAQNREVSLSALAEASTPWEVAQHNDLPTVLEFYADWCTTCQLMAADSGALAKEFGERVNFVMLDVDNSKWLPELRQYQVDGIPHFVFLDPKQVVLGEAIGFVPKEVMGQNLLALAGGEPLPHHRIDSAQKSYVPSIPSVDRTQPLSHN